MRTLTLFIFLTIIGPVTFAQSFLSEGKIWNERNEINFGEVITLSYMIQGDTVWNSLNYK